VFFLFPRTHQQNAFGNFCSNTGEFFRVLEKIHDLGQLILGLFDTATSAKVTFFFISRLSLALLFPNDMALLPVD
jgi:hypothetical protein